MLSKAIACNCPVPKMAWHRERARLVSLVDRTERNKKVGQFRAVKKSAKKFKGVRREQKWVASFLWLGL